MSKCIKIAAFIFCVLSTYAAWSQVRLPALVRDSMVLQRDAPIAVWGWASAGESVRVSFLGKTYRTRTGADGKWKLMLAPTHAGGPYTLSINATNHITLNNILVGDVWFCSGQSNMVHQLSLHRDRYRAEIAAANDPTIRQFFVPNTSALQGPREDMPSGAWRSAVGNDVLQFSAVAYFFAKDIHDRYGIPVGIINASIGGTPIEAWTSAGGLKDFPATQKIIRQNTDTAYVNDLYRQMQAQSALQPPVRDKGFLENIKWQDTAYLPKGWRTINVPGYWEDQGLHDLDGIVWYRKEINIPASMTGRPARLLLGRIVDADNVYVNGQLVGTTTYLYPQRRYDLSANLLHTGTNLIVVRVRNNEGKGGFVPDKPYCIAIGTDTLDLKGTWRYKVGEAFAPKQKAPIYFSAQNQPTALFNAMVAPVLNYGIKGVLWYQGESNISNAAQYERLLPALVQDWRRQFAQGDLPFLYVQLPGFQDYDYLPTESDWALVREGQLKALSLPNTAMAVAIDLGEWNDVHPDRKKEVGDRLALAARKLVYGEKNLVASGPVFHDARIDGNRIIINFTNMGSGLKTCDGEPPASIAIAGADKKFFWADTKIEGDSVIAWSSSVPQPLYVRYAWADNPIDPNLCNREGLPASPFKTDK